MSTFFLQDSPTDNGAACLATILDFHGLFVTPVDLSLEMEVSRAGASSREICAVAARYKLRGEVARVDLASFDGINGPFLAYVHGDLDEYDRTVVVFRIEGERLWVGDPSLGRYRTSRKRFAERYQGTVISFQKDVTFAPGIHSKTYLARFFRFLADYCSKIVLSLLMGLIASMAVFGLIYLIRYFVDEVLPQQEMKPLFTFALIYFLAHLLNIGINGFNGIFTSVIQNSVSRVLSEQFFARMVNLEKKHIDNRSEGDFLQLFNQIEVLTQGIARYFGQFILVVFGILIKGGLLIWLYDPTLVSILLVILCLNAIVGLLFSRVTSESNNRQILVMGMLHTSIINGLTDIRVIRIFGARRWFGDAFAKLLEENLRLLRRVATFQACGRSAAGLLNTVSEAAIFILCGYRILEGSYSLGDFLLFYTFAQGLAAESLHFPELLLSFPAQLRSFARVQAVLTLSVEENGERHLEAGGLEIELEHVSFGYSVENVVLEDVSFVLEKGKTSALVGESGSGKTTLMNLIMGFYKPSSGRILVNGVDLAELDLEAYRALISAVFQDTTLFSKTLYLNICLGDKTITPERVAGVAQTLGMEAFIESQPMRYDQLIYPGALSGGQTQQVGILRAMCQSFELLIMDEATSHLDSRTEEQIVAGMAMICSKNKTLAIIAHRLSTVRAADRIIALKHGRVAEIGNHDELVARKGYYFDLIQRQYEIDLAPTRGTA